MIERIKKVLDYSQLSTAVFADTIVSDFCTFNSK